MVIEYRLHLHKDKVRKETSVGTFRSIQKPRTTEDHSSMTSHFNIINKFYHKVFKQGDV